MKSPVYFADLRTGPNQNLLGKLNGLLDAVGLADNVKQGALVAVKLHFGEAFHNLNPRIVTRSHLVFFRWCRARFFHQVFRKGVSGLRGIIPGVDFRSFGGLADDRVI